MAAGSEIADLYVLLSGVNAPLLATFAECAAAGEEMVAKIRASMAELDASMAAGVSGAGAEAGMAAGVTEVTAAEQAMATETEAAMARVEAAVAGGDKAFADLAASAKATAVEVEASTAALGAELEANTAKFAAMETEATASTAAVGASMSSMGGISTKALIGVGVAAVGAGVEFAKMAGNFQQDIVKLNTSAGETQGNLKMVGDGILAMAGQVGYSSDQLATAMYKVESGGQHGAAGLQVLQAAAEGAKAENADLTTVADALTSAMTDYKIPADQAATTTSKLVAATSQGKMSFQELAGSMAAILPIASANHVSLNDILGDLASMTVHGMSAQQASDNLADAIKHMAAPTAVQSKELAVLGMNATEVSKQLGTQGLSGTINEISDKITSQMGPDGMVVVNLTNALKGMAPPVQDLGAKVLDGSMSMKDFTAAAKQMGVINDKNVTSFAALAGSMHGIGTEAKSGSEIYQTYSGALQKAMGDQTGMNVALMIGGQNASNTTNAINVVSGATAEAGNHVKGWAEIQGEFNFKLAAAKDGLGALAISIGEKLLPVLTPLVGMLADAASWLAKHQTAAVILASVLGGALVVGLLAAAAATWTWVSGLLAADVALLPIEIPVWALIAAIAALGLIVYEVMDHWSGIAGFFSGVWDAVKAVFNGALDVVMAPIHAIARAWDDIMGGFQNPAATFAKTVKGFDQFFIEIGQIVKKGLDDLVKFFTMSPAQMAYELGKGLGEATRAVVDFVTSLPSKLVALDNLLYNKGRDMIHGLESGIENGAIAVWNWLMALPGNIVKYAVKLDNLLYQKGLDLIHGAERGIEDGAKAVWDFLTALPGHVLDFFKDAPGWLYDVGKNILVGLWNGFTGFIGTIFSGIGDFISKFIQGFLDGFSMSSPSRVMMNIGTGIIQGLWQGLQNMMGQLGGVVTQVFHVIADPFANSGTWLVNAGYNICVGIYNGIASGWGMLTSMVSNLASSLIGAAKSALGIGSPSKVFADEIGAWIAPGLAQGVKATTRVATDAATQLARDVTQAAQGGGSLGGAGLSLNGGGSGGGVFAPAASGGGSGMNLQVVVQGHVWTTQDLVTEIQQQLLRHGIRNNTPGITYAYA